MKKRFVITYSITCELSEDEIWPDGDAPKDPTEDDVHAEIEHWGGIYRVIKEWNLDLGNFLYDVKEVWTGLGEK